MVKRFFLIFCTTGLLFICQSCFGQEPMNSIKRNVYLQSAIQKDIQQEHFNPVPIDDAFSRKAFDEYLKRVYYSKRIFTQTDIDFLSKYRDKLDDEYLATKLEFFDLAVEIIERRTKEAERYCLTLLETPFDFTVNETVIFDPDSLTWAKDTTEIKDRWRKVLKYDVMTRVYNSLEDQKKAMEKSDTVKVKSFEEFEKEARKSVEKRYKDAFSYVLKDEDDDYLATYINALLSVYDPHTEYYPPKTKEDFDIRFSGQLEGIGATLTQKEGFITITDIKIGSPSWKQGELEVNDKILKVTQGNTKETTDVVDMRLDKAIRFIRGPKGTEVILTVQKVDGTQKTISLIRDVIVIEETYAKSMVLTDKENHSRVGYIYLPSFYANFQDRNGRRCSVDVKNELDKLKAENVSGIILDLRSNTGGSLMDCVDISGHFIDQGPVVQVQGRGKPPQVLSDTKSGTVWDGPLVVLVNSYSASASEIFAAAMQDYGRAIIMGSTTYGKGTVQRFDDLDRLVIGQNDIKPLGSLKLTIQKFYRINGSSTQLKGVTPNIIVPDSYKYFDTGERELSNALAWSEIATSTYIPWRNNVCKWDNVIKQSNERIANNTFFAQTDENAKRLKQRRDESRYPLNFETYKTFIERQNNEAEKYKNLGKDTLNIDARILTSDEINPSDTAAIERNKKWYQMIITDNTIYEAMKVTQDMAKMRCFATRRDD